MSRSIQRQPDVDFGVDLERRLLDPELAADYVAARARARLRLGIGRRLVTLALGLLIVGFFLLMTVVLPTALFLS